MLLTREQFDSARKAISEDIPDDQLFAFCDALDFDTTFVRNELDAEEGERRERARIRYNEARAAMTPLQREVDDRIGGAIASLGDRIGDDLFRSAQAFR